MMLYSLNYVSEVWLQRNIRVSHLKWWVQGLFILQRPSSHLTRSQHETKISAVFHKNTGNCMTRIRNLAAQVSAQLFLYGNFTHLWIWKTDLSAPDQVITNVSGTVKPSASPTKPLTSAATIPATSCPAFTTTSLLWYQIISKHSPWQVCAQICLLPPPSRSNWMSNLSRCCVQVERRTASTASSLFRSLSTTHICIDLSSFWAGGMGGSITKRLIPIDLHRTLLVHLSFIW